MLSAFFGPGREVGYGDLCTIHAYFTDKGVAKIHQTDTCLVEQTTIGTYH